MKNEIRIAWSRPYLLKKGGLADSDRRRLELAEEAVIVDSAHRRRRHERPDGVVADWNEPGVLISFRAERAVLTFIDFMIDPARR